MDLWSHILIVICAVLLFSALQVVALSLSLKRKREERAILEMKRLDESSQHSSDRVSDVPDAPETTDESDTLEGSEQTAGLNDVSESFRLLLQSDREEFGRSQAADILSKLKYNEGLTLADADRRTITIGVYDSFDDVIRKLYDILPDIKKADIDTCMLSYLGCDNDVIAEIECVSAGAIRQRKSRLARRIPSDIYNLMV